MCNLKEAIGTNAVLATDETLIENDCKKSFATFLVRLTWLKRNDASQMKAITYHESLMTARHTIITLKHELGKQTLDELGVCHYMIAC